MSPLENKRARLDAGLVAVAMLFDHLNIDAHWSEDLTELALSLRSINSGAKQPPLFQRSSPGKKDHHILTLARCYISLAVEALLLSGVPKHEAFQKISSRSRSLTKAVQGPRGIRLEEKAIETIHKAFRYDRDRPDFDETAKGTYEDNVGVMNEFVKIRGKKAIEKLAPYFLRQAERLLGDVER